MYTLVVYYLWVISYCGPACSSFACALDPCHGSVPEAKPHDGRFLETELKLLGDGDGLKLNVRIPIRSALVVIGNYS